MYNVLIISPPHAIKMYYVRCVINDYTTSHTIQCIIKIVVCIICKTHLVVRIINRSNTFYPQQAFPPLLEIFPEKRVKILGRLLLRCNRSTVCVSDQRTLCCNFQLPNVKTNQLTGWPRTVSARDAITLNKSNLRTLCCNPTVAWWTTSPSPLTSLSIKITFLLTSKTRLHFKWSSEVEGGAELNCTTKY